MAKVISTVLSLMISFTCVISQLNQGGLPVSFELNKKNTPIDKIYQIYEASSPDHEEIEREDLDNDSKGKPYRIAVNIPIDLNINNAGTWTVLENGDKIWRLGIRIPGALALSPYFDENIYIPDGGKLFAYNAKHSQHVGAYTANTDHFTAMEMIEGDLLTLEYFSPSGLTELPVIDISSMAYYYRGVGQRLDIFREGRPVDQDRADVCEVDVACSEIAGWEEQRDAVVRYTFVIDNNTFLCSGTVVNNTSADCKPYVLSANHCGEPTNSSDLATNVWYFNYQRPTCSPGNTSPYNGALSQTMSGGLFRATSGLGTHPAADPDTQVDGCDFLLVELEEDIPDGFDVYYAGWDRGTSASASGVGIHHPAGHEKKISTYNTSLSTTTYNGGWSGAHWRVNWIATTNGHGVTEAGSSGSPIFSSGGKVVGQLSGGNATCSNPGNPDLYGKFNRAWDQDGTSSNARLRPWLDPTGTGVTSLDGSYDPCASQPVTYCEATSITCDEYISNVTIGGISNNSSCNMYDLYWETSPFQLSSVSSYLLEVTTDLVAGGGIGHDGDQIAAWIDWNRNGDFTDSNELILSHTINTATSSMPLQTFVNMPADAINGETRMRVRVMHNTTIEGIISPCGTSQFGEVEDYILNLTEAPTAINQENVGSFTIFPNPATGKVFIDLGSNNIEQTQVSIMDLTGRTIINKTPTNQLVEFNLEKESKGIYLVKVRSGDQVTLKKVVLH